MAQKIRKTLLLICEGTNSEPNYFYDIQKEIEKKGLDYKIIIHPKPPLLTAEEEKKEKEESGHLTRKRKKRQLKTVTNEPKLNPVPEEFKSQPARYVWYALDGLEIHDEAWSVFDKDGHANPQLAFDLANSTTVRGKKVNIAFSSISFETWCLLHYEYNASAFLKSQCRTKDQYHNCGQNLDLRDCQGKLCITGYLKIKKYISSQADVKHVRYGPLADKTAIAIKNAISLRSILKGTSENVYEINPYTDIDRLVFKLLHLERDYKWITIALASELPISFQVLKEEGTLKITLQNNTKKSFILLPEEFSFVNSNGESIEIFQKKILNPQEIVHVNVNLEEYNSFAPLYISIPANGVNGIFEIPF